MKTTGVSDIPKFRLLDFLGHPNVELCKLSSVLKQIWKTFVSVSVSFSFCLCFCLCSCLCLCLCLMYIILLHSPVHCGKYRVHCALLDHSKHPEDRPSFQSKETSMIIFHGSSGGSAFFSI